MSNRESLRAATAYAVDMRRHGLYGAEQSPYQRSNSLWARLRAAGANLRGDHHGAYSWYAAHHHLTQSLGSVEYRSHAWTLGVYTREMFYQYAGAARIDRSLPGALVTTDAFVSQQTLITSHNKSLFTLPFNRFNAVRIPEDGVWVLVVYDVENPAAEPELVYHEYSISKTEITTMRTSDALMPVSLVTAHHVHHLRLLDINVPRLLLRLHPCGGGHVELSAASVEINMSSVRYAQHMGSELGETTLSALINEPTDVDRAAVKKGVDAVVDKHRVSGLAGYYTTDDGQFQLGEPGGESQIASQAMAMLAISIAIRRSVVKNSAAIMAELTKINPEWKKAADNDLLAMLRARLSLEAMFAAIAPGGRGSPVLAELKRIFGDKGLPTIRDMLTSVGSGLPHAAPIGGDLAQQLDRVMAAKVDMDVERNSLISESYMADVLRRVQHPEWSAGNSPLTLAVLMSAMPETFINTVIDTLRSTLDMPNAMLKHAGVPASQVPGYRSSTRTDPGVYVIAPLDNYERAARKLLNDRQVSLGATGIKNANGAKRVLDAIEENPAQMFEARELQFCGISPVAQVALVQSDALAATDQKQKIKFDASKMHSVVCIKDTLPDGSSFAILLHYAASQSMVIKFRVAHDHRHPFLRDTLSAMLSRIGTSASRGTAVVAKIKTLVERTEAINAYARADSKPSSSDQPASGEARVPMLIHLLRAWGGMHFVPTTGSMDSGYVAVGNVADDHVMFTLHDASGQPAGGLKVPINTESDTLGSGKTAVHAADVTVSPGNTTSTVHALAIGSHLYVNKEAMPTLAAAQNIATDQKLAGTERETHDPFGLQAGPTLINPAHVNNSGERHRLVTDGSPLVPGNVGSTGQYGLMMSRDQRNDPSVYNSGPVANYDDWLSVFA